MNFAALFLTSFFGSIHCAGMCGGFVALFSYRSKALGLSHLGYHAGRLNTYFLLGLLAGIFGESLRELGILVGAQYLSSVVIGAVLIASGLASLLNVRPWAQQVAAASNILRKAFRIFSHGRLASSEFFRAYLLGITSTLLPCGWLYSYAAVAASTENIRTSVLVMFVFWLGTIPSLFLAGYLAQRAGSPLLRMAPKLTAGAMVSAGALSLYQHDLLFFQTVHLSCH